MRQEGKLKRLKFISRLLFILYMFLVVYMMFFSEMLGRKYISTGYRYNLTMFKEISRFYSMLQGEKWAQALFNLAGNVLCFVPFGLFLPFIIDKCKHFTLVLFLTFTFSFAIETTQLFYKVGSFDVDDIILNTLGGIIGYIGYYLSRKIYIYWEIHHEK